VSHNRAVAEAVDYPTSSETSPSLAAIVAAIDIDELHGRGQTSPDGTVTVMFTDVEGSTTLLERLGEEDWLQLMREHNRLLRQRISAHGGEVVKSQGDGYMVIFNHASAALACAVELQQIVATYSVRRGMSIRVRIGLHTGKVFQEEDDFLGRTVVVAARITGRAQGGEVLVSGECRDYTGHVGRWRFGAPRHLLLRGLSSPQRVHTVFWDEAPRRTL
jgi:eukaryotic-like serine/threonine-protein kinase